MHNGLNSPLNSFMRRTRRVVGTTVSPYVLDMPFNDPQGSLTAQDRGTGNHTLNIVSGATLNGPGEGLVMSGAGDVYVGASPLLTPSGDFRISVDAYMDVGQSDMVLFSTIPSGEGSGIRFATHWASAGGLAMVFNDTSNSGNYVENEFAGFATDQWQTVAIQRIGVTTSILLNGVSVASGTPPAPINNSTPLYLGSNPENGKLWRGQFRNLTIENLISV